jgi:hypothetical protein
VYDVQSLEDGLASFLGWIEESHPDGVILVSHGGNDARLLVQNLQSLYSDDAIQEIIVGFVDTVTCFKRRFPGQFLGSSVATFDKK